MPTADRKLWLTADKETLVEDGDPKAAFLFASEGDEVSDEDAERYGLKPKKAEAKQSAPAEDKQASAPANKARAAKKK